MAIQLSQLASRYNLSAPQFTIPKFNTAEDYQSAIKFQQEQERLGKLKAYGQLSAQTKLDEDLNEQKALLEKELQTLVNARATALEGTQYAVSLDQKIATIQEKLATLTPSDKTMLEAARLAIAPENSSTFAKDKNVAKMAETQEAIDNKWLEINKIYQDMVDSPSMTTEQKKLNQQKIDTLKAEAIALGRQYTLASQGTTYKSPYENDYETAQRANKYATEAKNQQIDLGEKLSKIKQTMLDDATKSIEKWTSTNQKSIDNINILATNVKAYEAAKQDIAKNKASPIAFGALVKSISKMMLPSEAVMADDVRLLSMYGGDSSATHVTGMLMAASQIAAALKPVGQAINQAGQKVITEVKETGSSVIDKAKDVLGMETKSVAQPIAKTTPGPAAASQAASIRNQIDSAYTESVQVFEQRYKKEVPNIIRNGDIYARNSIALINDVKTSLKTFLENMPDATEFRFSDAALAAFGQTTKQLLATKEGKAAWDNAVSQAVNAQFQKIELPGVTEVNIASKDTNQSTNTNTQADQKVTPEVTESQSKQVSDEQAKLDQKFLSPIGVPGTKFGELKTVGNKSYKWTKEPKSSSGGRWINNGVIKVEKTEETKRLKNPFKPGTLQYKKWERDNKGKK